MTLLHLGFDIYVIHFLRHYVVTCMNLVKIAGIKNWPTPEKVKDVCSFLGFCNFYRAFIKGFSSIARPLNALTQKDQTWTWTKEHQKAFDILKA